MAAVVLVGNAPSSGSTFLSDLLDCTSLSASGPELNLFSNPRLYDFTGYRSSPWRCGASPSAHTARLCIFRGELAAYGLNPRSFERLVIASRDFPAFAESFAERYLALRGKDTDGTVFEKTPQNVNSLGAFLAAYPRGCFIHLVRNPAHVYASLLKRGFPPWIALITWLLDVAQFLPYRDHPRVVSIHYEDLVRDPFLVVSRTLQRTCSLTGLREDEFMRVYENNAYTRLFSGRVDSWSVRKPGVVVDANRKNLPVEVLSRFAASMELSVHPTYARAYGFPPVTMREAVSWMGYDQAVAELLDGVKPVLSALVPDVVSWRMLVKKALYAAATAQPGRGNCTALLRPVVHAEGRDIQPAGFLHA